MNLYMPIAHTLPTSYLLFGAVVVALIGYVMPISSCFLLRRGKRNAAVLLSSVSVLFWSFAIYQGFDSPNLSSLKQVLIWLLLLGLPAVLNLLSIGYLIFDYTKHVNPK